MGLGLELRVLWHECDKVRGVTTVRGLWLELHVLRLECDKVRVRVVTVLRGLE